MTLAEPSPPSDAKGAETLVFFGTADQSDRPLPAVAREFQAAKQAFNSRPGADAESWLGPQARAGEFSSNLPGARYAVLALHGYSDLRADNSQELRPGHDRTRGVFGETSLAKLQIRLKKAYPELSCGLKFADGKVTALQVAQIDATALDLAVIGACRSALGPIVTGESILGIQRAFQVAGARTTVASLWDPNDNRTADLMKRFYGNLWVRGYSKLHALRDAKLYLIYRGANVRPGTVRPEFARTDPYFWAGWILTGDVGNVAEIAQAVAEGLRPEPR